MKQNGNKLTRSEVNLLKKYEATIDNGIAGYQEAGKALTAIQAQKLYRATHKTFEAYVLARFNLKRQRAYEMMAAGKVASNIGDPNLKESHAAELKALPANQQKEANEAVKANAKKNGKGKVTAKALRKEVNKRLGKTDNKKIVAAKFTKPTLPRFEREVWEMAKETAAALGWGVVQVALNDMANKAGKEKLAAANKKQEKPTLAKAA